MLKQFVTLTLLIGVTLAEYSSPVFLWGVNSPALPSLQTVSKNDFANLIAPLLKTHYLVVFQEEHLSSRDFLCQKDTGSESCYAHLKGFSPKTYYASVQNPSEAVRALTKSREYSTVDSTGILQTHLECETGKVTFISFDDIAEDGDRSATLEAHDNAIAKIAKDLSSCKVAFLYMSTPTNSAIKARSKRDTAATSGGHLFHEKNQFAIFFESIQYNNGQEKTFEPITIQSMTVTNSSNTAFTVTMAASSDKTLKFDITLGTDQYYTMSNVVFDGKSFYSTELSAPTTFSFSCGNLTLRTLQPLTAIELQPIALLRFNSLQFQAPFNSATKNDFPFGDSWDCTPFFTPAILMGLFVVILLLSITFIGICWLMDINTMDRFDDPKGKTITINAGD